MSTITKEMMKKYKEQNNKTPLIILMIILGSAFSASAEPAPMEFLFQAPPSGATFTIVFAVIMIVLLFTTFMLLRSLNIMLKLLYGKKEEAKLKVVEDEETSQVNFWKRFVDRYNNAIPVEQEKDIMLDHNYDGIRELDNSLPPWWVYGFYVTIIFAVIYMFTYHLGGSGISQDEEYTAEVLQAEAAKLFYASGANKQKIDESTVVYLTDATSLAQGNKIYQNNCATCHGTIGEGLAGPNLTDDYWIHGGGIKNIFKVITVGVAGKAMIKWEGILKPEERQLVASYVWSLHDKPVKGKDAEGVIYKETVDSVVATIDTTLVSIDTLKK
jgi:cytochrome c oxidase cbb3-type subunit 3